jgi:uncharacterized protein YbjT (DUF2867 family)
MSEQEPVLVVGATRWLGGQVVDRLLARGNKVRAAVTRSRRAISSGSAPKTSP